MRDGLLRRKLGDGGRFVARYVVDASVIVKWFIDEEYSDKALLLERNYVEGSVDIVVPELVL